MATASHSFTCHSSYGAEEEFQSGETQIHINAMLEQPTISLLSAGTTTTTTVPDNTDSLEQRRREGVRSLWHSCFLVVAMVFVAVVVKKIGNNNDPNGRRSPTLLFLQSILGTDMMTTTFWEDPSQSSTPSSTVLWHRLLVNSQHLSPQHHHHIIEEAHPPLFPLTASDWIGLVCVVLGLMIAAGGGIGGGGILVPIFSLVMNFSPKHAIPLSNVTVFGGSVANAMFNFDKRHPLADRPLIDWDLILVMEPLTIGGALIGAFLNKILPERLLLVLLVLLLSFTAYQSLEKAISMYKKENKILREQGLKPDGTKTSELTKIVHNNEEENNDEAEERLLDHVELQEGDTSLEDAKEEADKINAELAQILEDERKVPMANVMILCAMFLVVLTLNVLKGGGAFKSPIGIKCGSKSFWFANAFMIFWILLISLLVRSYLVKRYEIKKRVGYQYVEGDIQWDSRATIVYPCICMFAGFFAGMFGVGGGIVKGPLMLAMGVHPAVSSATSACMILFTCFTATTSFLVFGLLVMDYAYVCVVIGFLATVVGQLGLSYLMKRNKRNSYIAFSIGGVVLLSAILLTIQALVSIAAGERHHSGGICGKDD